MIWFLLFILSVIIIIFLKARECYECGKRDPVFFSKLKTRALCDKCWVYGKRLP
jgi:hypothetical protein